MGNLRQNQADAYGAARLYGLSDRAARAFVACATGESLAKPTDVHPDPSRANPYQKAHGICSWDDFRSERIRKNFGGYPQELSVAVQTKAAMWEIQNFYPRTWQALQGDDVRTMMNLLVGDFERPADPQGQIRVRLAIMGKLPSNLSNPVSLPPVLKPVGDLPSTLLGGVAWFISWLVYHGDGGTSLLGEGWLSWLAIGAVCIFLIDRRAPKQPPPEEAPAPQPTAPIEVDDMNPTMIIALLQALETLAPVIESVVNDIPQIKKDIDEMKKGGLTPTDLGSLDARLKEAVDRFTKIASAVKPPIPTLPLEKIDG